MNKCKIHGHILCTYCRKKRTDNEKALNNSINNDHLKNVQYSEPDNWYLRSIGIK